jgi:phytanoyl-CoA hydroxylase
MEVLADQVSREGWAVLPGAFTRVECQAIASAASERPFPELPPALMRWVADPRWADVVVPLLGPDVRLVRAQMLTKPARSDGVVPWHQDNDFLAVEPAGFLTASLAVDPMTLTNGCLHVVPGTHHRGVVPYVPKAYGFTLADPPPDEDGLAVELEVGDLLVLSSLVFHRSGPNHSDAPRRAWTLQFLPADAIDPAGGRPFLERRLVARAGRWLDAEGR